MGFKALEDKIREMYNMTERNKIIIAQVDTKKENTNSPNLHII